MSSTTHRCECTANQVLYVGVELSAKCWLLVMSTGPSDRRLRRRVDAGDRAEIQRAILRAKTTFRLAAGAPVRSCHEAGRDGFWPHRLLTALGLENLVVDSSSIEVPRGKRRAKTDKIDGDKLVRLRWRHDQGERDMWHVLRVPSIAQEDARQASRALTSVQEDRTRHRNRIHALLALHGVRGLVIDARLPERLTAAVTWDGTPLPPGVQERVLVVWRMLQAVEVEYRRLQRAERARVAAAQTPTTAAAQQLARLRGIAARTAVIVSDELLSRQPRNRREVGGLLGFGALPYDSGDQHVDQGISPGGVRALRRVAVEMAWAWRRYQPHSALTRWYEAHFGRGGPVARKIGIVALARRLFIALWRYAETGQVPEGAIVKA